MKDVDLSLFSGSPGATALLATMTLASLAALFWRPALMEQHLFRPYWFLPRKQYWTALTSGFLHADLPHLLFNGFTFWAFGFPLERHIGTPTFLALYAFGLAVSSAGTWYKHRRNPEYKCLGASGAILAVLIASIVYFPSASIYILPIPFPIPAPLFAVAYLGFSWYASRQARGRVNHDAHLSGALAGIAFVALIDPGALARALRDLMG